MKVAHTLKIPLWVRIHCCIVSILIIQYSHMIYDTIISYSKKLTFKAQNRNLLIKMSPCGSRSLTVGWPIQAYIFLAIHGFPFAWSPAHQPWNMERGTGFSSSENEKHHNMYCTYEYINRYSINIWIQYTDTAHQCPQHSGMARSISVKWHMIFDSCCHCMKSKIYQMLV